jgi:prepilin-type N-terminal cleavage/methylation domain-containing protein
MNMKAATRRNAFSLVEPPAVSRSTSLAMGKGFTLVELLVVITIVVVLLALLSPALDRAVYQAELAACASHQRTIGVAAVTYASEQRRSYPHRPAVFQPDSNWQVHALRDPVNRIDDRPRLRPYFDLNKLLNDPLAAPVNLETEDAQSYVLGNVGMFFGFKYIDEPGLLRMGDRLVWTDVDGWNGRAGRVFRIDVLTGDFDGHHIQGFNVQASHPDRSGVLQPLVVQDGEHPWLGGQQGIGLVSGQLVKLTFSIWINFSTAERGPLDINFGFQDLSVHRFGDMRWDEWRRRPANQQPGRMTRLPAFSSWRNSGDMMHVPPSQD